MNEPALRCTICNRTWNSLPPDAVRIGQRSGAYQMYRFDGAVHNIHSTKIGRNFRKARSAEQEKA
jgi:hypothetical protein